MKKLISLLCAMLLLALPTLALADDAHLTVTGTATITLPADRAILSIGVRTTAATATDAAAQNADGITALLAALEAAGILPEDRPKVFERFFTADRAHTAGKGTGLGLSICQRILEMHGQRIWLKDTQAGAAFAFTLERAGH